jgi:hypothetical protein
MPLYDIDQVDRAIMLAFHTDPGLVCRYPIRKPRYENNCLLPEQVEEIIAKLANEHVPESYSRMDGFDEQGDPVCMLGTCGYVLYVGSAHGSACIDVDDTLVQGAGHFS